MYFEVLKPASQEQFQVPNNCQLRSCNTPTRACTFTKHQCECYIEVGSLLRQERSVATGRREYSDLPEVTKHPITLPHGYPVVEKIIQSVHKELLHAGPESTLSVLRQEIWLTKGRRAFKRVLGKCLVCQRHRVGPRSQRWGH